MKNFILAVLVALTSMMASAQSGKQVKWTYSAKKIADKTYEVHLTATIPDNWYLCSQTTVDGPIPTSFTFNKNSLLLLDGTPKEVGKLIQVYSDTFQTTARYYEKSVDFIQKVKLKGTSKTSLTGKIEFMVFNDAHCSPPTEVTFSIKIGG